MNFFMTISIYHRKSYRRFFNQRYINSYSKLSTLSADINYLISQVIVSTSSRLELKFHRVNYCQIRFRPSRNICGTEKDCQKCHRRQYTPSSIRLRMTNYWRSNNCRHFSLFPFGILLKSRR